MGPDPALLKIVREAGVSTVWVTGFFYGYWPTPVEELILEWKKVEGAGMSCGVINLALGHPGDSLGAKSGKLPLTPPKHWKPGMTMDRHPFAGTSLHAPATDENVAAINKLREAGARQVFLDDDFRLARSPGTIGGCFCDEHRERFLKRTGYSDQQWDEVVQALKGRELTAGLREWVEFTCDDLSGCFRAQREAGGEKLSVGNMVMYMGAEKAGIRLADYANVPLRVGELSFDDGSFGSVKGKTNELFSALFHRRFVRPELAYSESTAFPADRLSARNMAAKLAVSTIADVRNTMFMSGLTPFPVQHWKTLGPAMKRQKELHETVAGHVARGPFKHYWGEAGRYVGDDNPFSLFLAAGVPFEVCDALPAAGWVFLGDADARALGERRRGDGKQATAIVRPSAKASGEGVRAIGESMEAVFALKRELTPQLVDVPVVMEEKPVVCAWYPSAKAVLLWNLSEREETFTIRIGERQRQVTVGGLETELVANVG